MAFAQIQGPLNRAKIDNVVCANKNATEHRDLWETTNMTLGNHQTTIDSQAKLIASLTARIAALEAKG